MNANTTPILFEDFQPGTLLGEHVEPWDAQQGRRWQAIFGDQPGQGAGGPPEAASMVTINMMRAFLKVVAPRPPGNVHARQQLRMHGVPEPGESMRVTVACAGKEIRRERRHVELEVSGTGNAGRKLFDGRLFLVWAA